MEDTYEDAVQLSIYISSHCANCDEAYRIANRARRIRDLEVDVINLDETTAPVPASVFAVPTYLIDGAIVSLGNPRADEFLRDLQQRSEVGDS
jgi:hypothetical protein